MPDAGVLPGPDPVFDAGVRAVPSVQERELPASGVGGESLVAVAVAALERVQGRTWMWELAAHDDPHPGAGLAPAGKVEQVRDLDDVSVLPQPTVGVVRALPGALGCEPDRISDGFGDGVTDRELQSLLGKRGDQSVGVAGAVSADQDLLAAPPVRDLTQCPVQHGQVIGGGVAARVARAQQHLDSLVAVVQPRAQGWWSKPPLNFPRASSLSECAVTSVASRSITTSLIVLPAAREPGSLLPVSSPRAVQARSRASARASRGRPSMASSMTAKTRQIVEVD